MVALRGQLNLIETSLHGKVRSGWRHLIRGFVSLVGASNVGKSVRIVGLRSDRIPNREVLGEWRATGCQSNRLSTRLCAFV